MKRDNSHERSEPKSPWEIKSISAVTLATHDMTRAVRFYRALGFTLRTGGEQSLFTSLNAGSSYVNITLQPSERSWSWWGRVIFYVSDLDAFYEHAIAQGLYPDAVPRDAPWGERYFHISDPDGHELSFARLLSRA
jgi:catechol 2,3-dioxygenase-like lactoylglutathione lyase family enzyme